MVEVQTNVYHDLDEYPIIRQNSYSTCDVELPDVKCIHERANEANECVINVQTAVNKYTSNQSMQ